MTLTNSRAGAVQAALAHTLGRPWRFLPTVIATAVVLATLLLGAIAAWRLQPLEAPPWVRPQALVLAAGAEGESDLAALGLALRKVPAVVSADFVGRDAALADLAQRPGLASQALRDLRPNPLPDAFVVTFATDAGPDAVEAAVAALRKVASVDSVQYQPDAYRRTWALARLARRLLMVVGTALGAALVIGAAVAASLRVRPDPEEIRLLYLLGAEPAAIRRPFVYSGALALLIAAGLAWWIAASAAAWFDPLVADLARQYALHWSTDVLPPWSGPAFCGAAGVLGAWIGSVSIRLAIARAVAA
jgi:cell division transport system permease protein